MASAQYPLGRLVYFNVDKKPGQTMDPVMRELVKFLISKQGQRVVGNPGVFIPLRCSECCSGTAVALSALMPRTSPM